MAQPAVENRLDRVVRNAHVARKSSEQYSSQGGWTPEELQALKDTRDALVLLIADSQAALDLVEQDITECENELTF